MGLFRFQLLKKFNMVTNIYSEKAYDKLDFHVRDSINMANIIGNSATNVIDLGSGSGFPARAPARGFPSPAAACP